jgi:hypothetical protein
VRGTGVHHFDLVISSLDRSLPLYRELLEPLGYTRTGEIVGERGERVVYLSGNDIVSFSLRESRRPATTIGIAWASTTSRSRHRLVTSSTSGCVGRERTGS